jgi:hypothetical protein
VQNLPRKGGIREAFVALPGHLLLVADYAFIELRTLAAECEARYGASRLADVIRAGVDPHAYTAAMFEGMGLEDFMALKSSDRGRYNELRQRAKVLTSASRAGWGRGRWWRTRSPPTASPSPRRRRASSAGG